MDNRGKHFKDESGIFERESYRVRSIMNQRKRRSEMKTRVMLFGTGFVLVVVLTVLAFKLAGLNGESDKQDNVSAAGSSSVNGKKKWLRDGLDPDKPMVALTFDDGPYTPVTSKILKVLKKYDARATFFVVGNRVPQYEDMVKQAYEQGNEIATHTYNHANLTKLSKKGIKDELNKSREAIKDVIGCSFSTLRPPGGSINDKMRSVIKVPMIYWSVDTEDWKSRNAKSVLNECEVIQDGDLYPSTADAVKKLVPRLVKEGYQLVTVDEMFHYKGINAKGGKVYMSGR